ncbi:hypothetical protein ACGF1Z_08675 [Streptomyces sp. NPDC048018]|uniref:hypothetical protein n=1 Tax=Streptomyces sp. NPDC048018 TaxID=3365499 RepID=UPI003719707A
MALLLVSCSDYAVRIDTADQLTGVWSDFAGRTVEFKDDGTFTANGLDKADVGTECSGIAAQQRGTVSLSGPGGYGEVSFDGVDCAGMKLAFYGSPTSFVACFTQDVAPGTGCTGEFHRQHADSGAPRSGATP